MIITDNNDALQGTEYKTLIAEAHSDFQQSVINGISKLRESGFSKQRAIEILLTFVRQKDPVPSDDEVRIYIYFRYKNTNGLEGR